MLLSGYDQKRIKIEEETQISVNPIDQCQQILEKYSNKKNNKTRFLELSCDVLNKISNSESGRFYLMENRITIPVEQKFEEAFLRDILAKCKIVINFKLFLILLQKEEDESLDDIFQYEDVLFKKFSLILKKTILILESKEKIKSMENILNKLISREKAWDQWKSQKCEGNITKNNEIIISKSKYKFAKLEEESLNVKIKTSKENEQKKKFIFKRTAEKKELEKMKNWISLREKHDLISNLETEDLWIDTDKIEMRFDIMTEECLKGNSLNQIKKEIKEFEKDFKSREDIDEYVKWRFTNRLVKRSYESLIHDHEKDFCNFINKNVNCFNNKVINDNIIKLKYSKEGTLLKQKNKKLRELRNNLKKNDKGKLLIKLKI